MRERLVSVEMESAGLAEVHAEEVVYAMTEGAEEEEEEIEVEEVVEIGEKAEEKTDADEAEEEGGVVCTLTWECGWGRECARRAERSARPAAGWGLPSGRRRGE
jgi:hypothetical protein